MKLLYMTYQRLRVAPRMGCADLNLFAALIYLTIMVAPRMGCADLNSIITYSLDTDYV